MPIGAIANAPRNKLEDQLWKGTVKGAFDRDVPVPPRVDAWQQARMRAGLGAEDSPARFLQNYIDDSLAASLADRVVLPPQWAHMQYVAPRRSQALGTESSK